MSERCTKCGGNDIAMNYHKPGCLDPDCFCAACMYGSHNKRHDEHLHYHCRRCHYDWTGDVLQATSVKPSLLSMRR